jgi:hypothetical protein
VALSERLAAGAGVRVRVVAGYLTKMISDTVRAGEPPKTVKVVGLAPPEPHDEDDELSRPDSRENQPDRNANPNKCFQQVHSLPLKAGACHDLPSPTQVRTPFIRRRLFGNKCHLPCYSLRPQPELDKLPDALAAAWDQRTDRRTRRVFLHISYSYASPCGPALLVTQDPYRKRRSTLAFTTDAQKSALAAVGVAGLRRGFSAQTCSGHSSEERR